MFRSLGPCCALTSPGPGTRITRARWGLRLRSARTVVQNLRLMIWA